MNDIRVLKLNLAGEVTWQYDGRVLRREPGAVTLQAYFNRADLPFQDVVFKEGDRFVETFYEDRWYNVFEIYDRDTDSLKGWYCNITRPAAVTADTVSYVDLALDLWVSADGRQTALDEDEFEALKLDAGDRQQASSALAELQHLFETQRPPF
jgi:predicted RNA-binding protein associated with RNAse of E/G family